MRFKQTFQGQKRREKFLRAICFFQRFVNFNDIAAQKRLAFFQI
jgi:hypothetical protein